MNEACDLISMLPDGSAYVSAIDYTRAWTDAQNLQADLIDELWTMQCALHGIDPKKAPRVTRPKDIAVRIKASAKKRSVTDIINNGTWEESNG